MSSLPKINLDATKISGGCLCGAVRYDAEAYLKHAYYCHCKSCQKSTGQPAEIGVLIKSGTLSFNDKSPKYYNSSSYGKRGFCENCGSRLVWQSRHPNEDWATNVDVCSLDHPEYVEPVMHIFFDEKVSWFDVKDDLPRTTSKDEDAVIEHLKAALGLVHE